MNVEATIAELLETGLPHRAIAAALNAAGSRTRQGNPWTRAAVCSRIWLIRNRMGEPRKIPSAYIPTSKQIDYQAARIGAMDDRERGEWLAAREAARSAIEQDKRRRAGLASRLDRLRAEAASL